MLELNKTNMRHKTIIASEAKFMADKRTRLTLEFLPYDVPKEKENSKGKTKFELQAFHRIDNNTIFFVIETKDFNLLQRIEKQAIKDHTFFVEFSEINKETGRYNLTQTVFLFERIKSINKHFFSTSDIIYVTMQMR